MMDQAVFSSNDLTRVCLRLKGVLAVFQASVNCQCCFFCSEIVRGQKICFLITHPVSLTEQVGF